MVELSNNRTNTGGGALGRPLWGPVLEQMEDVGVADIISGAAVDSRQNASLDPAAQAALAHMVAFSD